MVCSLTQDTWHAGAMEGSLSNRRRTCLPGALRNHHRGMPREWRFQENPDENKPLLYR
jgi:hypothetical protein